MQLVNIINDKKLFFYLVWYSFSYALIYFNWKLIKFFIFVRKYAYFFLFKEDLFIYLLCFWVIFDKKNKPNIINNVFIISVGI